MEALRIVFHSLGADTESIMKASVMNQTEKWSVLVQKK
jgi:hypothetical protein